MNKKVNINKYVNVNMLVGIPAITVLMFLVGMLLHDGIMHFIAGAEDTVFPLGSLLALFATVLVGLLAGGGYMFSEFHLKVSMGATRREFFTGCMIQFLLTNAMNAILVLVLSRLEHYKLEKVYSMREIEMDIRILMTPGIMVMIILLVTCISTFFAAFIIHFGKNGFWVLWGLYMGGCILMTRFGDPVLDFVKQFLENFQYGTLGLVIPSAVVALVGIGISWLMLRKQPVYV